MGSDDEWQDIVQSLGRVIRKLSGWVPPMREARYLPHEVCSLTGLSYRQLQYWDTSGFLSPCGSSRRRLYLAEDLAAIILVLNARQIGISIQRLRALGAGKRFRQAVLEAALDG